MTVTQSSSQDLLPAEAVQILTPEARISPNAAGEKFLERSTKLDPAGLQDIYRLMRLTRRVDQEATALQRQGQLVLWAPSEGQEAAQAATYATLKDRDYIFPTYREHALVRGRGIPVDQMMTLYRGAGHGGWNPDEFNTAPYTVVLGAQVMHAAGYGWGIALDQQGWEPQQLAEQGTIALACFGDGASSEGDVHEAMVYAASFDAPVVFFCQNNHWAISVPFEVQSRVPVAHRAAGYGFEGIVVDGNDPLAVYAVMDYATEQARTGQGPVLVEAYTYRLGAHTTADDPTKYRTDDTVATYRQLDPMHRTETYLRETLDVGEEFFKDVDDEAEETAAELRKVVLDMTLENIPPLDAQFDLAYAEPHSLIDEERAELADWLSTGSESQGA